MTTGEPPFDQDDERADDPDEGTTATDQPFDQPADRLAEPASDPGGPSEREPRGGDLRPGGLASAAREAPSGGLPTPRPGGWKPASGQVGRPAATPPRRDLFERPRPTLPGDPLAGRTPLPRSDRPSEDATTREVRNPARPERPPERGTGPERPSERGTGPERPSERGTGPGALTRPLPPVPIAPRRPAEREGGAFRHPGAALTQPSPAPARPAEQPREDRPTPRAEPGAPVRQEPTQPLERTVPARVPPPRESPDPAGGAPARPRSQPHTEITRTPSAGASAEPPAVPARIPAPPTGPTTRRLVRISPRSVFRAALALYLGVLASAIAALAALWVLLQLTGAVPNIESFVGELLGYEDFQFLFGRILLVMALIGLVWVVLSATFTALLAGLYNRVARITGGVRVVVDDEV